MSHLHRTQIYLAEEQLRRLKLEAGQDKLPVSELIRRAINHFLRSREKKADWKRDPLIRAVGKVKLTVQDASVNHDSYIYGKPGRR
jgi:hypothetical protein